MRLTPPRWSRVLPSRLVVACATLGPLGQKLPAPGTWGSLAGLLYFLVFFYRAGAGGILVASAVGAYLAVAICGEAENRLGKRDPGEVVLDEFVAIPLCFLGWHSLSGALPPWTVMLAGLVLFRFFDIVKPLGISRLQRLPGGWGVVVDDLAAALATCATLHVGAWVWGRI
ncbi:MAG: phosphatidylglycerophosphatase A [Phycisphaerales bacterium]|nr:phosphatidylglycerophosphatase A [Phycisphaerales bacterium]